MPESPQSPPAGRAEVLAAATDLFGESGFDAVSISAIAQRAGTSKANVFHHFGSKEALYLEVMRDACGQFAEAVEDLRDDSLGFEDRLVAFIRRDIELMHEQPDRSHLILREVLESGPSRGRELAGEVFHDHFGDIVALFAEGQQAGVFSREVPPSVGAVAMIACNVFLFQSQHVLRYLPGVDFVDDPARYAALISRVLLDGLRSRGEGDPASEGSDT
ncbi:MAG: TetR/AcrR family transcriptional regulator [Halofilum sp. (in: g-proteobacteria)]|nr:TetR/AcrR family transcriptional regulator [Halofilum sp. (in: g-proteobacteria)]